MFFQSRINSNQHPAPCRLLVEASLLVLTSDMADNDSLTVKYLCDRGTSTRSWTITICSCIRLIPRSGRVLTSIFQLQNSLAVVLENQVLIIIKRTSCMAPSHNQIKLDKKLEKIVEKLEKIEVSNNPGTEKETDSVAQNAEVIIRVSETRMSSEGMQTIQEDGQPVNNKWLKCHRILGAPMAFSSPRARYKSSILCLFTSISRERF